MAQATAATTPLDRGVARPGKLGPGALNALMVGPMIAAGAFSLPQNMAAGAAPAAIPIGWLITSVGILALAFVLQGLATRKPELYSGPYAYALSGYGRADGANRQPARQVHALPAGLRQHRDQDRCRD